MSAAFGDLYLLFIGYFAARWGRPGRKQPPSSRRARGAPCPSVFYLHFTPELSKSTVTVPSGLTVTCIRNERINLPSDRGLQVTTPVSPAVTTMGRPPTKPLITS